MILGSQVRVLAEICSANVAQVGPRDARQLRKRKSYDVDRPTVALHPVSEPLS